MPTLAAGVYHGLMPASDDDDKPPTYWDVLSLWVKVLTFAVALPAWLWWMWQIVAGTAPDEASLAPFFIFGAVAIVQIFFLARAVWRMDL